MPVTGGSTTVTPTTNQTLVRKASDESVTSSDVLQNDNELNFAIGANETWIVDAYLIAEFGPTGQIQVGVNAPAVSSLAVAATISSPDVAPDYGYTDQLTTGIPLTLALSSTAGFVHVHCTIVCGASGGTFVIQWAQAVSNATPTTVKAGSSLVANRIS